ncbi:iron transporter [Snodgrassella sp. CFCC 13594]|uniref:iron transporter n=1 Tax=Snodgrassella sp. CFCC 13594 TaxID=1775559 RepID=UPI0008340101|nr:iron transporter [Snodgrassella sp. CFCC 13594]
MNIFQKAAIVSVAMVSTAAFAQEYPMGKPVIKNGMEIAGVYLPPITMDTDGMNHMNMHLPANKSDVHMEADIHATEGNPNGFAEGDWMPNLNVEYTVTKLGGSFKHSGKFMSMVASDGPHYGDNVKLDGLGKYRVTYRIAPPSADQMARHIDKETGVAPWFKPFEVSWDFDYAGVGRKGSY